MTLKNARTNTLKKYINDDKLRLSDSDRAFFKDLTKVGLIDEADANQWHYQGRKTSASKRLDRLVKAGILTKRTVSQPAKGNFSCYEFATDKIASLFGGKRPTIGAKRNALHEAITSKLYFAEGRPDSWVLERGFSKNKIEFLKESFKNGRGEIKKGEKDYLLPDAMFYRDGEIVLVEADSGQYTKKQIRDKQKAWKGLKQVWGQPAKASAVVDDAKVYRFN